MSLEESLLTVNEVAKALRISPNRAINLFANEPGVLNLGTSRSTNRARRLRQLRIPVSVLERFKVRCAVK
jgi:hypothetical protein